jgi:hypothetical protein
MPVTAFFSMSAGFSRDYKFPRDDKISIGDVARRFFTDRIFRFLRCSINSPLPISVYLECQLSVRLVALFWTASPSNPFSQEVLIAMMDRSESPLGSSSMMCMKQEFCWH